MKVSALIASLSLVACAASLPLFAQAQSPSVAKPCAQTGASQTSCGLKVTPAASAMPRLAPFSLDATVSSPNRLRFLALDQMAAPDRALLDQAAPRIALRAANQGFHVAESASGQGSADALAAWNPRQVQCSALPGWLVMSFTRDPNTNRTASFTVAIPRTASGRLHLVPVERRGFSLYTPSSRNAMTRVVFNDLLREDRSAVHNDWLGLGLCYAALAGFHVEAATTLDPSGGDPHPAYMPGSLSISWKQPPSITLIGLSSSASPTAQPRPMQWTLVFTRSGTLGKVKTRAAHGLTTVPAKGAAVDLQ